MHKYVITLEWSYDRVLAQLAAMAASDIDGPTSKNYFLSPAWACRYFSQWPSNDFFVAMAISTGDCVDKRSSNALVVFSRGRRASRLSSTLR